MTAGGTARRAGLLFAALLSTFLATSTGRPHVQDEWSVLFQARGLVTSGTISIPADDLQRFEFYGKTDLQGRARAPYGPAQAIAIAPFYALGAALARAPGVPERDDARLYVAASGVTCASAFYAALAATLLFVLLERRGVGARAAVLGAVALGLGTPLFAYSGWGFSEPIASALFLGAALAVFGHDRESLAGQGIPVSRAMIAGALLGVAILLRPVHAIAAPVFGAAILAREGRRGVAPMLALGAMAAAGLAAYLAWNWHLFGDPLDFGYPIAAEGGKRLNGFETPILRGLAGFLFSPGKSIFLFAPPIVAGVIALPSMWRRDRGLALLAALLPAVYIAFYARYTQWEGGYCFGPRYIVPAMTLLIVPLGERLSQAGSGFRRLVVALVIAGALVQSIGLATSFLEDERHGGYYDARNDYVIEHSPIASQAALLLRYATDPAPAPLGKGFDRWFVFLDKMGVDDRALGAVLALEIAGALLAMAALLRASCTDR